MKKRILILVTLAVLLLGTTACGSSAPTNTPAGGGVVESSVVEATAEPTEAPTPEPTAEPTPEPTATPEPTPEPTPFVMPEEPTVYIDGVEITLPCTWGEFSEKTGRVDPYDDSIFSVWIDAYGRAPEAEDLVYGVLQGKTQGHSAELDNVSLPGGINVGTEITVEELISLYGEPTYSVEAYGCCNMRWGLYGTTSDGYQIGMKDGIITDVYLYLDTELMPR